MIVTVVDPPLQSIVPSTADAVNKAGSEIFPDTVTEHPLASVTIKE